MFMRATNVQFRTKFSAGLLPPLRQTAQLDVRAFVESVVFVGYTAFSGCIQFSGQFPFLLHCRAAPTFQLDCRFGFVVGLYKILGSVSTSSPLSGCTLCPSLITIPIYCQTVHAVQVGCCFHYIVGLHFLSKSLLIFNYRSNYQRNFLLVVFVLKCKYILLSRFVCKKMKQVPSLHFQICSMKFLYFYIPTKYSLILYTPSEPFER